MSFKKEEEKEKDDMEWLNGRLNGIVLKIYVASMLV